MDRLYKLSGVSPVLSAVLSEASVTFEMENDLVIAVTEGLRTKERQLELFKRGLSQTLRSRHLDGRAVDVAILSMDRSVAYWRLELFEAFNEHVQRVAHREGVGVLWGGHWSTLRDGPHFEISANLPAKPGTR